MDKDNFQNQMEGNWHIIKGSLKKKYGQLTDDDLTMAKGQAEKTFGKLQKKLGKTKEELEKEMRGYVK
jgi:uncharacterized protein YjbJ (UPF0337 family)